MYKKYSIRIPFAASKVYPASCKVWLSLSCTLAYGQAVCLTMLQYMYWSKTEISPKFGIMRLLCTAYQMVLTPLALAWLQREVCA